MLLQLLDEGRLTDGQGRTVDFKNTIVIMTSNLGSYRILEYRGAFGGSDYERMKETVLGELRERFRPEFLNRVDETIVFHALSEEHLERIVEIQLRGLERRLAEKQIELSLGESARRFLVRAGYDPSYGARPLKRAIRKELENPLGLLIVRGELKEGHSVQADYHEEAQALSLVVTRSSQPELEESVAV